MHTYYFLYLVGRKAACQSTLNFGKDIEGERGGEINVTAGDVWQCIDGLIQSLIDRLLDKLIDKNTQIYI